MSNGIYIANSSGYTQVDEEYSGFRVIAEGTTYANIEWASEGYYYHTPEIAFPAQITPPLVMVCTPIGTWVHVKNITTSSFSLYASYNTPIHYKVMGRSDENAASSETFGLRVFRPNGAIAFDSGHSRLLIQQTLTLNVTGGIAYGQFTPVNIGISDHANTYFSVNSLTFSGTSAATGGEYSSRSLVGKYTSESNLNFATQIVKDSQVNVNISYTARILIGKFTL